MWVHLVEIQTYIRHEKRKYKIHFNDLVSKYPTQTHKTLPDSFGQCPQYVYVTWMVGSYSEITGAWFNSD